MIPGKAYTPEDFLRIAWRRKWMILVPFVLASVGTYLVVKRLPNLYRSQTLILVVPQRVPDSYVRSTVTATIGDRLRSISEQILSRSRLERVIQDFNLYVEERKTRSMEDIVDKMRRDIGPVETVKGDSFIVGYTSGNALTAKQITERLASMFIEENVRDRVVLADGTSQFLESQLENARARLIDSEKKLEAYRQRYDGELPSQLQANILSVHNAETQVQVIGESINRDRDRKLLQERLLADLHAADGPAPKAPASVGGVGTGASTVEQLETAQATLADLELRLKPDHPDVIRSKRAIKELEAKVAREALKLPVSDNAPPARLTAAEAAQQNRIRELQLEIENLDQRVAEKQAEQRRLGGMIAAYQRRIAAVPTHESELTALMRDYDTLQKSYASLLTRKEDSKTAADLERRQIGEQFKILDPAREPERPISPNRQQLDLMGAAFGLAIGLGMAVLFEYLDSSLKTEEDVVQALMLPVLALIPLMTTSAEDRSRQRRRLLLSCLATLLALTSAAAVAAWKLNAIRWIR
jgi:polysaccharide chain length determinant protein (PEP-CTERM system associated)